MKPLEESIRYELIPALTNRNNLLDVERDLLALPPRMGGLGIINPAEMAKSEYENSQLLTGAMKKYVVDQNNTGQLNDMDIQKIGYEISKKREIHKIYNC